MRLLEYDEQRSPILVYCDPLEEPREVTGQFEYLASLEYSILRIKVAASGHVCLSHVDIMV